MNGIISSCLVLSLAFCSGCVRDDNSVTPIRLSTGPMLPVGQLPHSKKETIQFAIAGVYSAERSSIPDRRFARYIARQIGQPVEIVRRRTFKELNELLRIGAVQAGILCTGAFAIGREQFGLRAIAMPIVNERTTSKSYIVARKGSLFSKFDDLHGAAFAFSDPYSNSGYRYVADRIKKSGFDPSEFFKNTIFTYSQEATIQAVRDGIVDAGSVDSLIWNWTVRHTQEIDKNLVIILASEAFPINPVVVSPQTSIELADRISHALTKMNTDTAARGVLDGLGISGFSADVDERRFDPIVDSWKFLGILPSAKQTASEK